jgi:ATP-binding cassette subfamily F protein uup
VPLITLRDVRVRFRGPPLLDGVSCHIEAGQRIGLLGRNGAGKTTLMRLLAGDLRSDSGEVIAAPGTRVAMLRQEVPQGVGGTIRDVVATGLDDAAPALAVDDEHDLAWRRDHAIDQILSRMDLDPGAAFDRLSSGMKRRGLLARALVAGPDLLLLDEPTNHLDIDAIEWLETFLGRWGGTLLFVTHDRAFLRRMATRILEIDRGRLFDWSCDYDTFLDRKEQALASEEKQAALFDKRLAEEEVWIRTGIKARRTRNEGRVRRLEAMRRERGDRRERQGRAGLKIQEAQRSGALVAELEGVSFARGEKPIIADLSLTVMRGDRIGIVGPNGAGKSTLLGLVLGSLAADAGTVRLGTNLQVAFFDQLREQLDDEKSVADNVSDGSETIRIDGQPRHVLGYLKDFLFDAERARLPVKFLSGGERNRVLLARHFAKPANLIVLDEPTNDLDAETLELLEERLMEFTGTVIVVSHDRAFLDNVVTSLLVFEPQAVGPGRPAHAIREYVGGYSDWLRQRADRTDEKPGERPRPAADGPREAATPAAAAPGKRKLSYKDQQELAALPATIERLEAEIAAVHAAMAAEGYFRRPGDELAADKARLDAAQANLVRAYERWETLEAAG